jgi:hypothetical protein
MYMYMCLQFNELFSHLPVPVLLRQSLLLTLSGSTSKHRGSHKHRGFKHCVSNDSIDFHRHRGLERRGSNKQPGFEHRGSKITEASTSTVASPSTVALINTVASSSTEAQYNSTRNTEWPLALNYNIHDAPILSHRPHFSI